MKKDKDKRLSILLELLYLFYYGLFLLFFYFWLILNFNNWIYYMCIWFSFNIDIDKIKISRDEFIDLIIKNKLFSALLDAVEENKEEDTFEVNFKNNSF